MAFYKKQKQKGKWYPRSFTIGTWTTDDVAKRLSVMSTVSKGDTYAVLLGLGEVLGDMLKDGYSVKLDGLRGSSRKCMYALFPSTGVDITRR